MGRRLWITASAVALLWSGAAQAQQADAVETKADKDQAAVLGDVVVTAERRTSNLQTTAVAATVLSGEDLAAKGVLSLDQLQFAAPSTTVQNFGQGNFFNVRGIGKSEATTAVGVGVITYRDGVAAFPAYFQTEPYYDIGSLELLRGPQGTFAGANATGGAVFITARNPDFSGINGYVFGQAGNYNDIKLQGAINLPLSDTLAARLAFNHETRDSFYTIAGPYRGHPGVVDSNSVRASLLWQPTDALKVLWKTDYNNIDLGGYPADPALATNDPFHITSNGPNEAHDEFVRSSLNVSYVFDSGMTLKSITGYQAGRSRFATDLDGTSALNNTFVDQLDEEVWSQEFNLISPDQQRLTWLLGLYYQYDMARFPAKAFPTAEYRIGFPENVLDIYLWGDTPKETAAVFGQVSYDITDRLQLQVGARYAHSVSTNDDVYTTYPQFGIVSVPGRQGQGRQGDRQGHAELETGRRQLRLWLRGDGSQDGRSERAEPVPSGPDLRRRRPGRLRAGVEVDDAGRPVAQPDRRLLHRLSGLPGQHRRPAVSPDQPHPERPGRHQDHGSGSLGPRDGSGRCRSTSPDRCPTRKWATSSGPIRAWDARACAIRRRGRPAPTASTSRATPRAMRRSSPSTRGSNTPSRWGRT